MRVFPHLIQHHRLAVVRDGNHAREVVPCVLGDVSTTSIRVELMGMIVKRAEATTRVWCVPSSALGAALARGR